MIGEVKHIGSVVEYIVEYSVVKKTAVIVSASEAIIEKEIEDEKESTSHEHVDGDTTTTVNPVKTRVFVVKDKLSTHTFYPAPVSPEVQKIIDQLEAEHNGAQTKAEVNFDFLDQIAAE